MQDDLNLHILCMLEDTFLLEMAHMSSVIDQSFSGNCVRRINECILKKCTNLPAF